ncbi:MAG: hypothetical protein K0R05_3851 [Anaerocolumna sp.]|jgi:hypothetical protein|nr:hypothetical protein [Anaerocolumna sp.]
MDEQLIPKISELPTGDKLTNGYIKKIQRLFPVPSDYKILWAVAESLGHHPSGLVIADKGIIIKANKKCVEEVNVKAEEGKCRNNTEHIKFIYQIIPWDLFDPDDYIIKIESNLISITVGETSYTGFTNKSIIEFFNKAVIKKRNFESAVSKFAESGTVAYLNTLGLDGISFAAAYGADQTKTGHGIYAEEAGALLDRISGEAAEVVGRDNAKNGPDKVVNGRPVQCKYCNSANSSVGNCFKKNAATGAKEYRYITLDGTPMMVEVPKDQYAQAVEVMKKKIKEGSVPGISDPNKAYDIIRQGKLTYKQARNLAKAGTFESITYDAATGAVNCSFAFGISVLITFGFSYANSKDAKKSLKAAALVGLQTFGFALVSQIISSQIARTSLSKALIPASDYIIKKLGVKTVQKLINGFRALLGKKAIYGGAAQKSLAKALRSNVITEGVAFVVFSVPDTIKVSTQQMSVGQYLKNMSSLIASFAGTAAAVAGAAMATAKIGEKLGKSVDKRVGGAIGFGAGLLGGGGAGFASNQIGKLVREDDAEILLRLFNSVVMNVCLDNMLSESEIKEFLTALSEDKENTKKLKNVMKSLYSSKEQYRELEAFCNDILKPILAKRTVISKHLEPNDEEVIIAIGDVMNEVSEEESSNEEY